MHDLLWLKMTEVRRGPWNRPSIERENIYYLLQLAASFLSPILSASQADRSSGGTVQRSRSPSLFRASTIEMHMEDFHAHTPDSFLQIGIHA